MAAGGERRGEPCGHQGSFCPGGIGLSQKQAAELLFAQAGVKGSLWGRREQASKECTNRSGEIPMWEIKGCSASGT